MELEFTQEELKALMKEAHEDKKAQAVHDMIKYCRHLEKEKVEGRVSLGGLNMLNEFLSQKIIPMSLYLPIRECVLNPDSPYKITLE